MRLSLPLVSAVMIFFASQQAAPDSSQSKEQPNTNEYALQVWEQAIAAKGGRERLKAVQNIVISSRGEYITGSGRRNLTRKETFVLLPNKAWEWADFRPDVFGLSVATYDFDKRISYHINSDASPPLPVSIPEQDSGVSLLYNLLPYLLETKWIKPTVIDATTRRIDGRLIDVLRTTVRDEIMGFAPKDTDIDFSFDHETHLPVRVDFYHTRSGERMPFLAEELSDYSEANGIKVPQNLKYADGSNIQLNIQFNVDYSKDIFEKPPSIAAGPEAWRQKTNHRKP